MKLRLRPLPLFGVGLLFLLVVLVLPEDLVAKGTLGSGTVSRLTTRVVLNDRILGKLLGTCRAAPTAEDCRSPEYARTPCGKEIAVHARQGSSECSAHCGTPSPADCSSETFWESICGEHETVRRLQPGAPECYDFNPDGTPNEDTVCPPHPSSTCADAIRRDLSAIMQDGTSPVPGAEERDVIYPSNVDQNTGDQVADQLALQSNGYGDPTVKTPAKVLPTNFSSWSTTGNGGSFLSRSLSEVMAHLDESNANTTALRTRYVADRAGWGQNGNRVRSCEEYVYEKYWDYSRFEDAAKRAGVDYRDIWAIAFANGRPPNPTPETAIGTRAIGGQPLRQKDGTPFVTAIQFPAEMRPKNEFFETPIPTAAVRAAEIQRFTELQGEYTIQVVGPKERITLPRPVTLEGVVLQDDDLAARMAARPLVQEGWAYHRERGQEYGPELDEEMYIYDRLRTEYIALLVRRHEIVSEVQQILKDWLDVRDSIPVLVNDQPLLPGVIQQSLENSPVSTVQVLNRQKSLLVGFGDLANAPLVNASIFQAGFNYQLNAVTFGQTFQTYSGESPVSFGTSNQSFTNTTNFLSQLQLGRESSFVGDLRPLIDLLAASFMGRLNQLYFMLAQVDERIEASLLYARDQACLETGGFTTCDWSPQRFAQRVLDQYMGEREFDYRQCHKSTGGDFTGRRIAENVAKRFDVDLWPSAQASRRTTRTKDGAACEPGTYDDTPTKLERYFLCWEAFKQNFVAAFEETLKGAENIVDPETGALVPRETASDADNSGDKRFRLSYSHSVSWELGGLAKPEVQNKTNASRWCALEPSFSGAFDTSGRFLGADFDLVEGRASMSARPNAVNRAYLKVVGITLLSGEGASGGFNPQIYNVIIKEGVTERETIFRAGATVMVGPVPVTIRGGVAGFYGADLIVGGGRLPESQGCGKGDLGLEGKFSPFFGIDGFASASVDALVVEVGVKISLVILKVLFPFQVRLIFEGEPIPNSNLVDTRLRIDTTLDAILSFLSGRVSAFIEICFIFCETIDITLFRWPAITLKENLLKSSFTLPVGTLAEFSNSFQTAIQAEQQ